MPRRLRRPSALLPALIAAGSVFALPAVASAATVVSQSGNTLVIVGDEGPSSLSHDSAYNGFQVQDDLGGPVTAGAGCAAVNVNSVACSAFVGGDTYGKNYAISANLGGGDDVYKYAIFDGPQTIDAGDGNDSIEASGGNDTVQGGLGNDTLWGMRGDDTLDGGAGNDKLDGADGNDTLTGGPGVDTMLGDGDEFYGAGNDVIMARDGEGDSVSCGGGADRAEVDGLDVVAGCEAVDRPAPTPTPGPTPTVGPGPGPNPTPGPTPTELVLGGTVTKRQTPKALSQGKKITVTLKAKSTCTGKVAIALSKGEAKRLKLGKKALTIGTSTSTSFTVGVEKKVDVGVDAKYRTKIKNASKIKTTILIACAGSGGATYTGGAEITFKK